MQCRKGTPSKSGYDRTLVTFALHGASANTRNGTTKCSQRTAHASNILTSPHSHTSWLSTEYTTNTAISTIEPRGLRFECFHYFRIPSLHQMPDHPISTILHIGSTHPIRSPPIHISNAISTRWHAQTGKLTINVNWARTSI